MCPDPSLKKLNIKERKELREQMQSNANVPGTAVVVSCVSRHSHLTNFLWSPHFIDVGKLQWLIEFYQDYTRNKRRDSDLGSDF